MGLPPPTRWSTQRANGQYKDHLVGQLTMTLLTFFRTPHTENRIRAAKTESNLSGGPHISTSVKGYPTQSHPLTYSTTAQGAASIPDGFYCNIYFGLNSSQLTPSAGGGEPGNSKPLTWKKSQFVVWLTTTRLDFLLWYYVMLEWQLLRDLSSYHLIHRESRQKLVRKV